MTSAIGVAVLSQFAAPASAASLINETFGPAGSDNTIAAGNTIGAFTVSSGDIDLIGAGGPYDFYPTNGKYIDLNGNNQGTITSTASPFNFTYGGTLSFLYGANGANRSATVSIGGTTLGTITASQSGVFSTQSYTIASGTTGALKFTSNTSGNAGIILDSIVLNSTDATSVPEPFTMIGTLVGGTAAIRLRKKLKVDSNV